MWIIYAGLSAIFAAATAILAKIGIEKIDSNLATAIRTTFVVGFAWIVVFVSKQKIQLETISQKTWIFLFLSALATGLSWLFYFRALQIGQASRVAPIDKMSLVLTIIFAALFLGEKISWQVFLGAVLMTIGTIVIALAK
jgi:bacterial/archaeal transporter family protein